MVKDEDHFELVIEAEKTERNYWIDLWRYRELFYFLAWRDVLVRYKQTVIGVAWSVIRPLLSMFVFTVVFGKLAKMPSENAPYPILVYAALLPWTFFSASLSECSESMVRHANMVSKIYFPRLVLPASSVILGLMDFFISFGILGVLMLWYDFTPTWHILTLPLFLSLAFLASFGAGLWFSALNAKYRDVRYLVPFVTQFGMYISPVGFSSTIIPEKWKLVYSINPMVGVIDGFRWAILGGKVVLYMPGFILSVILSVIILIGGLLYFRKAERTFADII